MKCLKCSSEMELDDKDFDFPGKGQKYYCCTNTECDCCCEETIRFHRVIQREWFWDEDIQKTEKIPQYLLDGGEFDEC